MQSKESRKKSVRNPGHAVLRRNELVEDGVLLRSGTAIRWRVCEAAPYTGGFGSHLYGEQKEKQPRFYIPALSKARFRGGTTMAVTATFTASPGR